MAGAKDAYPRIAWSYGDIAMVDHTGMSCSPVTPPAGMRAPAGRAPVPDADELNRGLGLAYFDQPVSCGNAYDRDQRPVVVGRGWILAVISLTETNSDSHSIAEALGR